MSLFRKSLLLTFIFEGLALVFRYGFQLESTRDTASIIGALTFNIRIHHAYIGVLLVVLAQVIHGKYVHWLLPIGIALILSDLIHHFLILLPIEGNAHFDLVYPDYYL